MKRFSPLGIFAAAMAVCILFSLSLSPAVAQSQSDGSSAKPSLRESLKELEKSLKDLGDALKGKKTEQPESQPAPETSTSERPTAPTPQASAPGTAYITINEDWTESAVGLSPGDRPWAKTSAPKIEAAADVPAMRIFPTMDINELSRAQYNGAVSAAMEAMRDLMGELTPDEEAKFQAKWAPLFDFPTEALVEYFNKLNPLLSEFLAIRVAIAQATVEFDGAWEEAVLAASYESEEGVLEALAIAAEQKDYILALQRRMAEVAQAVQALGNPPSPIEAQQQARRRHRDAIEATVNLVPRITITPRKLDGKPGTAYTFSAKVENVPGRVTVNWAFGDGKFATDTTAPVKHTYAHEGEYVLRAVAYDAKKARIGEASARVNIGLGGPVDGAWVLQQVHHKAFNPAPDYRGATYRGEIGANVFGIHAHKQTVTPIAGQNPRVENQDYKFRVTWADPPKQLIPDKTFTFSLKAELSEYTDSMMNHIDVLAGYSNVMLDSDRLMRKDGQQAHVTPWHHPEIDEMVGNLHRKHFLGDAKAVLPAERRTPQGGAHVLKQSADNNIDILVPPGRPGEKLHLVITAGAAIGSVEKQEFGRLFRIYAYTFSADPSALTEFVAEEPVQDEAEARAEAERQAKQDSINFHRANILIIETNLAKDRADLAKETDTDRRAALEFRILQAMSDAQTERDRIATLETGRIVRTRTAFDDYVHAQFIHNIRETQQKFDEFQRATAALQRLAGMLPPEEAEEARRFIERQLTAEVKENLDQEAIKRIASAIGNKVQGHFMQEASESEDSAAWANLGLESAQNVQRAADRAMMACSIVGGGRAINVMYQAATGYIDGGPVEAVLKSASYFGTAAYTAAEAFRGYQDDGLSGAVWRGGTAFVTAKALEYAVSKLVGPAEPEPRRPTVKEQFELARFKQAQEDGRSLVNDFARTQGQLEAAARAGKSARELSRLQAQLRDKAAAINSSPHAKNFLKYRGDFHAQRAYNAHMRAVHADVEAKFHQQMTARGWNRQELMEFRNASSAGSVGMDYDIGLNERAMRSLTQNGRRATVNQWQQDAQKAWDQAYRETTKRSAGMAWENVTTSAHAESYRDLAWLGSDKTQVSRIWAQQSADVTRYKMAHMLNDPSLTRMEALQEVSRGAGKDMGTKLQDLLRNAQPANQAAAQSLNQARAHWQSVQTTLDAFGNGTIDPITAERRIRELTGGKGIPEVVDDMATLMESLIMQFGR